MEDKQRAIDEAPAALRFTSPYISIQMLPWEHLEWKPEKEDVKKNQKKEPAPHDNAVRQQYHIIGPISTKNSIGINRQICNNLKTYI